MSQQDLFIQTTQDNSHTIYSGNFNSTYHSNRGAVSESEYVFIRNGLVYMYEMYKLEKISILEIGFGTGLNAYLTYIYATQHQFQIHYEAIEAFPIAQDIVQHLNYTVSHSEADRFIFKEMHACKWNSFTELCHLFQLHKHHTKGEDFATHKKFDLIYFDAFAPVHQPELWTKTMFANLYALLNNKGILVTYCAQGQMKRDLKAAGFKVEALPGALGKREMTRALKET